MTTIRNLQDLADHIGCEDPDRIERCVYKYTECGCTFSGDTFAVQVSGYAEGADAECPTHILCFPFEACDWDEALESADREGCDMWHEWNDLMECNSCSEIELPVRGGECGNCGTPCYF